MKNTTTQIKQNLKLFIANDDHKNTKKAIDELGNEYIAKEFYVQTVKQFISDSNEASYHKDIATIKYMIADKDDHAKKQVNEEQYVEYMKYLHEQLNDVEELLANA